VRMYFTVGYSASDWFPVLFENLAQRFKARSFTTVIDSSPQTQTNPEHFIQKIQSLDYENFEDLYFFEQDGDHGMVMSYFVPTKLENKRVFELTLTLPCCGDMEGVFIDISRSAASTNDLLYGYAQQFKQNISPQTEQKIRRSIFGSEYISVSNPSSKWEIPPENLETGAFKKKYKYNLLTLSTAERFSKIYNLDINKCRVIETQRSSFLLFSI
jgi:hypothetical protein